MKKYGDEQMLISLFLRKYISSTYIFYDSFNRNKEVVAKVEKID
ncbi:hypothetical protein [Peribacillus sp. TH14]|nr:hypothetical protein [Peribacillus sp. TH14]